jgi:hypothetical protein
MARPPLSALAIAFLVALCAAPAAAQSRDPREFGPDPRGFDERYYRDIEPPREAPRPVGGTKYCSIYVPNNWRDTFPVPAAWRWTDCRDFAAAVGATHVHFMCVFSGGRARFSIGGPGDLPNPDCGWGDRGRREEDDGRLRRR